MDDLRPHGPGRLVLQGLAIMSAVGFVVLLMVQAMAFYAPTPEAPKALPKLLGPATKAAPVLSPQLREESEQQDKRLDLLPATKAGILGPLKRTPPEPAPQQQGTPPPRD